MVNFQHFENIKTSNKIFLKYYINFQWVLRLLDKIYKYRSKIHGLQSKHC